MDHKVLSKKITQKIQACHLHKLSSHRIVYKKFTQTMETPLSSSSSSSLLHFQSLLPLNSPSENNQFITQFSQLNSVLISPKARKSTIIKGSSCFLSTSMSMELELQTPLPMPMIPTTSSQTTPIITINKHLSVFERAFIGACAGGSAGAFTHFCLHPLDTIKTKLQIKGASQIYKNTLDAVVKTFQTKGVSGFYSGISAVIVGSTFSSALMFGTCEFGKSILSKFENYPSVLIPPTAGIMGNIVSSGVLVPKELITQRMQAGAKGKSWEILLQILKDEGVSGLYAGYSATLLRNLPAGVLSYSSFEWLKAEVIKKAKTTKMTPLESVCCGALAGAISATLTTPLDVVKTRLMTQIHGVGVNNKVAAVIKQIIMEEGWVGFSRGMGARVVHSACFSAIGYFAFETARLAVLDHYIKHRNHQAKEGVALYDS